jgi:hypothetical protein
MMARVMTRMNEKKPFDRKARDAEKAASRREDAARLAAGEDPMVLQRENSIFPKGFFKDAKIENRAQSLGR